MPTSLRSDGCRFNKALRQIGRAVLCLLSTVFEHPPTSYECGFCVNGRDGDDVMKSIGMRGAAFIFVLCVLVLSHSLFWGQTVKLTAMFDKTKGEAVLQYHIDGNNELLEKKVRINKEKAAKIKGRENLRI